MQKVVNLEGVKKNYWPIFFFNNIYSTSKKGRYALLHQTHQ